MFSTEFPHLQINQSKDPSKIRLTDTMLEVLQLLAAGATLSETCEWLQISDKTLRNRLTLLYDRIGCPDRTAAALWAAKHKPWESRARK